MKLDNIALAHYQTQNAIILHGSSGYGKTSVVNQYARNVNACLFPVPLNTKDVLTIMLPVINHKDETIRLYFVDWMKRIMEADRHTVVFFDEITRPSSKQVFDMIMELFQARSFDGRPIPDCVQFIGATNFASEDINVQEMPNALWTRATHLTHAPMLVEMLPFMRKRTAKFLTKHPEHCRVPLVEEFPLDPIPRQYEACEKMFETGILSPEEVKTVCIGRLGIIAGSAFAEELIHETQTKLPSLLTRDNFNEVNQFEKDGKFLEVIAFLSREEQDKYLVALYLAKLAYPETVRTFWETTKFKCLVKREDFDPKEFRIDDPVVPWHLPARQRDTISFKKADQK